MVGSINSSHDQGSYIHMYGLSGSYCTYISEFSSPTTPITTPPCSLACQSRCTCLRLRESVLLDRKVRSHYISSTRVPTELV